jgi:triosephosphate isomerase
MRKHIIAGNWKLNGNSQANAVLMDGIISGLGDISAEVIVCPPSVYLNQITTIADGKSIKVGAQNINIHRSGAYTGEISGDMVRDVGCEYVILGHSERRSLYGESNEVVAEKIQTALNCDLTPIFCIGETLEERETDKTHEVLADQINAIIDVFGIDVFANIIVAYEPVWAIGTGVVATPEQAQDAHKFVRELLAKHSQGIADNISILYGGSMNPSNCVELLKCPDIDGGLIGGASLKAEDFLTICRTV